MPDHRYEYKFVPAGLVADEVLEECSRLYSAHYGKWSAVAPDRAGAPVRLSASRIREWTSGGDSRLAIARLGETLIGYAIVLRARVRNFGTVSWVTQFVVHGEHRNQGVGRRLLFAAWSGSSDAAWGVVTSNPYAVRALEKATRRRCNPKRIRKNIKRLRKLGLQKVPYVGATTEFLVRDSTSAVNTEFFVDHSRLAEKLESVTSPDKPWMLGDLPEGWEWFAFCFRDQDQLRLTRLEIEEMLKAADAVAHEAYGRMKVKEQPWAQHTVKEVDEIVDYCSLVPGDSVLDLGCGTGRHARELARRGLTVVGVDYSEALVAEAKRYGGKPNVSYLIADCRALDLKRQFDAVLCLYDVVGTYADDRENARLLASMRTHLRPGGSALLSVMNLALTRSRAKNLFLLSEDPNAILSLASSQTMERTGDIFNPEFYLLDRGTGVVYRREAFSDGSHLPTELIVRDRRFLVSEIRELCSSEGLEVEWSRCVRAGHWGEDFPEEDSRAKEVLVFCRPVAADCV